MHNEVLSGSKDHYVQILPTFDRTVTIKDISKYFLKTQSLLANRKILLRQTKFFKNFLPVRRAKDQHICLILVRVEHF